MLKNYLKIAWKVLQRRKFFTFISLFGISFTLMILVPFTAEMDSMTGAYPPESNSGRMLFIKRIIFKAYGSQNDSSPSYYFLNRYVRTLKLPENVSIYSHNVNVKYYTIDKKLKVDIRYTDSNFWQILDFNFLKGRPFTKADVDNVNYVAVLSKSTSTQIFGNQEAVGKTIELNRVKYKVIGIVEDVTRSRNSYANIWLPVSTTKTERLNDFNYIGGFEAMILAKKKADMSDIISELHFVLKKVERLPGQDKNTQIFCPARNGLDWVMGIAENYSDKMIISGLQFILGAMFLFMMLPTLNLVNINISRIMERSSEIAIRKSFGASSLTLVFQFLVENLIITILGSFIGVILGIVLLRTVDAAVDAQIQVNYKAVLYYILISLFFGILSGVYPAYKMSRLSPVDALRGDVK